MPRLSEVLTGDYLDRPALMSQRIAHILKASTGMLDENYESVSLLLYQPDGVPDTEGWVTGPSRLRTLRGFPAPTRSTFQGTAAAIFCKKFVFMAFSSVPANYMHRCIFLPEAGVRPSQWAGICAIGATFPREQLTPERHLR